MIRGTMPDPAQYKLLRRSTLRALERDVAEELRVGWQRVGDVVEWSTGRGRDARTDYTQALAKRSVVRADASERIDGEAAAD